MHVWLTRLCLNHRIKRCSAVSLPVTQTCSGEIKERPNAHWAKTTGPLAHKHILYIFPFWSPGGTEREWGRNMLAVSPRVVDHRRLTVRLCDCGTWFWTPPPGFSALISSCKCSFPAADWKQWAGRGIVNVMLRGCPEMAASPTQFYITLMEQWGGCQCPQ